MKITRIGWMVKGWDKIKPLNGDPDSILILPLLFLNRPNYSRWKAKDKPPRKVRVTIEDVDQGASK